MLCFCFIDINPRLEELVDHLRQQILSSNRDLSRYSRPVRADLRPSDPQNAEERANTTDKDDDEATILFPGEELVYLKPTHLSETFGKKEFVTPLLKTFDELVAGEGFLDTRSIATQTIWRDVGQKNKIFYRYLRAGPREKLYFEPSKVVPAIVTCGGLCPGMNNVIRAIALMLFEYGVPQVWGIKNGYMGICDDSAWIQLTRQSIHTIHQQGGSFLVSNRGNDPTEKMVEALMKRGVNMIYIIGGDGTHRGAGAIEEELIRRRYECSVVGIPKTIDNDIPMIDNSFGFGTAVSEAVRAIEAAFVESVGAPKCIGLVKLMGRRSGFVVLYAVCSSALVDVALLPEMDISLPKLLRHIKHLIDTKGHCVVVVAEGCGATLMQADPSRKDAGGNIKLPDVGLYMRDQIMDFAKKNGERDWTVKYIDPTYMIRAVPANAYDSVYCHNLAHNAVHGAMAGYTGFSCCKCDQRYVMLPFKHLTSRPPRQVNTGGRWYARMIMATEQVSLAPPGSVKRKSSFLLT
jgi:6-phosphofructokinase 1